MYIRKKTAERVCQYCNKTFMALQNDVNRGKAKYCSIGCGTAFRNKSNVMSPKDIFYKNVIIPENKDECWLYPNSGRYGKLKIKDKYMTAHRFSYELHNGEIGEGMCILHLCDVPACVNPQHLFLGTSKDNRQDMLKKGRGNFAKGSKHHHSKLNEEQIAIIKRRILNGEKMTHLAVEYNVSYCMLTQMKAGRSWRHVQPATPTDSKVI